MFMKICVNKYLVILLESWYMILYAIYSYTNKNVRANRIISTTDTVLDSSLIQFIARRSKR
jgi:hypothetical protein